MPPLSPRAATFCEELLSFIHWQNATPDGIRDMLRSNHHWQALHYWTAQQKQSPARSQKEADALVYRMLRLECWLADALSPDAWRPELAQLPNLAVIRRYVPVMIRAARAAAGLPAAGETEGGLAKWRTQCERSFSEHSNWPAGSIIRGLVRCPAAVVWTSETKKTPEIAWLELETLPGDGETASHPGEVWSTIENKIEERPEMSFGSAMQVAFQCARTLAGFQDPCRGRWRIVDDAGTPLPQIYGDSAGGAALLGWYQALTGTVPDPRVLVMAAVRTPPKTGSGPWRLDEVGGVEEKARAALLSRIGIDTIGTVAACESAARNALGDQDKIRVVRLDEQIAPLLAAATD